MDTVRRVRTGRARVGARPYKDEASESATLRVLSLATSSFF